MIGFLKGLIMVIGCILLAIVGFFAICFLIFVPAMIAKKCGAWIKIIVTALYILVGLGLGGTIIAIPLAVLLVKHACAIIYDEQ